MNRITSRDFRANFQKLTEPVEVLNGTKTVGFFYPGETPVVVTPVEFRGIPTPRSHQEVALPEYRSIPGKVSSEMPTMTPGLAPRSTTSSVAMKTPDQLKEQQKKRDEILKGMTKGTK